MQPEEDRALHECACIKCGEAFNSYDGDAQYCGLCKALAAKIAGKEAAIAFLQQISGVVK